MSQKSEVSPGKSTQYETDYANHHVFKTPVSVRDLAKMLIDIDMSHMPTGSSLHFTEKTAGGVCMSLSTEHDTMSKSTQHCILETSNSSDWPFIPEIQPMALLQSLSYNTKQPKSDRWGLLEKRIAGLVLNTPLHRDPPCVNRAAHYVLQCIKSADEH